MIFCYSVIMIILYSAFLIIRYYGNSITVSLHKIGGSSLLLWEPAFFPKWYFQGYQAALREKRYTQQAPGSGLPSADPTEGSLSERNKIYGYFHKQPYNQNVSKIKNIVTIRAKQRNKFTSYSCSLPLSYGGQPQQLTESRRRLYPSRCGYLQGRVGERLSRGRYGAIWGNLSPFG